MNPDKTRLSWKRGELMVAMHWQAVSSCFISESEAGSTIPGRYEEKPQQTLQMSP